MGSKRLRSGRVKFERFKKIVCWLWGVIAPIIMKFGIDIKLHVFYTIVTKTCDITTIT